MNPERVLTLGQSLEVVGLGMGVVLATLLGLCFLMFFMGYIAQITEKAAATKKERQAAARSAKADASTLAGEHDPVLVAVLAAAAHTALGVPVQIKKIRFLGELSDGSSWSRQGRLDIMHHHSE